MYIYIYNHGAGIGPQPGGIPAHGVSKTIPKKVLARGKRGALLGFQNGIVFEQCSGRLSETTGSDFVLFEAIPRAVLFRFLGNFVNCGRGVRWQLLETVIVVKLSM